MGLLVFGDTVEIVDPELFFALNKELLKKVEICVRRAFDKDICSDDIYEHAISPEFVYLLESRDSDILAFAGYNQLNLSGIPCLVAEGIAVHPSFQGRDLFRKLTDCAANGESVICLRTQNPRMYRALEKYCSVVYSGEHIPEAICAIRKDLASHLGCTLDEKGVVKGYYGGLFYGKEPVHKRVSPFFEELGVDVNNGDALLAVGVR